MRFSLLTLLAAVMLLASSAALWWNYEAWEPMLAFKTEVPIIDAEFSPDDRLVLIRCLKDIVEKNKIQAAQTYDSQTGKILHTFNCSTVRRNGAVHFSPGGKYLYVDLNSHLPYLWRADTGEPVDVHGYDYIEEFSPQDHFARMDEALVKIPSFEKVTDLPGPLRGFSYYGFSPAEHYIVALRGKGLELISTQSGNVVQTFPNSRTMFSVAPDDEQLALYQDYPGTTSIYDTGSGKQLQKLRGMSLRSSFSPDSRYLSLESFTETKTEIQIYDLQSEALPLIVGSLTQSAPNTPPRDEVQYHNHLVLLADPFKAVDLRTRQTVFDLGHCGDEVRYFSNADSVYFKNANALHDLQIRHTDTGKITFDLNSIRWRHLLPPEKSIHAALAHKTPAFLLPNFPNPTTATLFRLTKPNLPFDLIKMPELYLTLFFAAVLLRQFLRSRVTK